MKASVWDGTGCSLESELYSPEGFPRGGGVNLIEDKERVDTRERLGACHPLQPHLSLQIVTQGRDLTDVVSLVPGVQWMTTRA